MRVTLKQLQYFDAVARTLHFGRAAASCSVSQPALSAQIQELESHLGAQLVERARSGIKLTRLGQEVAARAEQILSQVMDLEGAVSAGGLAGSVRLGVIPTVAPYVLPGVLRRAGERHPEIALRIQESQTARLTASLRRGDLDLLLLALPIAGDDLVSLPLFEDEFMLAVPAAMKLAGPVALGALPRQRLLLLEEGHCLRDQALSVCQGAARETLSTLGASSLATLIELVAAGQGVTLLPRMCATAVAGDRRVRLTELARPVPSRAIGLVWRRSSARGELFTALGGIVCEGRGDGEGCADLRRVARNTPG
jgi:LysR family hydrogen peroxide-inducible transcriptional activator